MQPSKGKKSSLLVFLLSGFMAAFFFAGSLGMPFSQLDKGVKDAVATSTQLCNTFSKHQAKTCKKATKFKQKPSARETVVVHRKKKLQQALPDSLQH